MRYRDLNLPKGLNTDFFLKFLSEKELMALIREFENKPRSVRKIILPSRSCIRKCIIYYLVKKHHGDFDKVMKILKQKEILAKRGLVRSNIVKLYFNRKKEIEKEK